jgi:hypothetical protein
MPEQKSSAIGRLQREADVSEKQAKELARVALLTTNAKRRRRMTRTAASLLRKAQTLRARAAELEKEGFQAAGALFGSWFVSQRS